MSDNLTKEQRHKNMSSIKGKNTSIEVKVENTFGLMDFIIARILKIYLVNQI